MKQLAIWCTVMLSFLVMTACNSTAEPAAPAYTKESPSTIAAGDLIPVPAASEVVLTIQGNINNTNVGDTLQFDMATLEALGTVSYAVEDKQAEGGIVTFEGVLISRLLEVAQAADTAETLHTIALNDYAVDIPVQDVAQFPVLIATKVNSERMPVERYGPTRIVYPYHAYNLDITIYDPRWIWQLAIIEVR